MYSSNEKGFTHVLLVAIIVVAASVIGFSAWRITKKDTKKDTAALALATAKPTPSVIDTATTKQDENTDSSAIKTPTPPPAATPLVNSPAHDTTGNCASELPSSYTQNAYSDKTTSSEFMATDANFSTKKFRDALEFAGLLDIVDNKKTTVFTMTDYTFDSLTSAQLAYMNKSPENMKSVLGWHIITSCVTFNGSMKDVKTPITLQTLNGSVTYTPENLGKLNDAPMSLWDWFTSNGVVNFIAGYINPPQV